MGTLLIMGDHGIRSVFKDAVFELLPCAESDVSTINALGLVYALLSSKGKEIKEILRWYTGYGLIFRRKCFAMLLALTLYILSFHMHTRTCAYPLFLHPALMSLSMTHYCCLFAPSSLGVSRDMLAEASILVSPADVIKMSIHALFLLFSWKNA